jgi:ABC-type Mn2+/Zn2+ transport system ATPase subunit
MEASANKNSTHFGSLFFDEALDGLDNALKLRSYDLFCELEKKHDSIFVIEHNNDLQTLFSKLYYVRLEGDESFIEEK